MFDYNSFAWGIITGIIIGWLLFSDELKKK